MFFGFMFLCSLCLSQGEYRVPGKVHADAGGRHNRRMGGIEAVRRQRLPPGVARLEKVDRHEPQVQGTPSR